MANFSILLRLALGLLPVLAFLASLLYLDSYKLVSMRRVLLAILAGCSLALLCWFLNHALLASNSRDTLTGFIAPLLEETAKGLPIAILIWRRRIGFLVDAAIFAFAIGTGFALVENLYYLSALNNDSVGLWIVRGFGTAVMHGGTTTILALLAKIMADRFGAHRLWIALPGLLVAFSLHALFNHFVLPPLASALAVMLILPPLLFAVFSQSERFIRQWVGTGFDLDAQLLDVIHSGRFASSAAGQYLQSLREHFEGAILADMLCYLRLNAELALRAKGMLLLRENGFELPADAEVGEKLAELSYLRRSIGKTGRLALSPLLHTSKRDLWQLALLQET
jgi:RsiW-degrading membrane proteinase PrsW (M82 family)